MNSDVEKQMSHLNINIQEEYVEEKVNEINPTALKEVEDLLNPLSDINGIDDLIKFTPKKEQPIHNE